MKGEIESKNPSARGGPAIEIPIRPKTPEMLTADEEFVKNLLDEVANSYSRTLDPTPIAGELLDPKNLASDEKLAGMLAKIEDDPNFGKDLSSDQGVIDSSEAAMAKVKAAMSQVTDPQSKDHLQQIEDNINFYSRRYFIFRVLPAALVAFLAACNGINVVGPIAVPDGGGPLRPTATKAVPSQTASPTPSATETSTATATKAPTETAPPTATETSEPVDLGTEKKHVSCDPTTDFKKDGRIFKAEQEALKNYKKPDGAIVAGYKTGYPAKWWEVRLATGSFGVQGDPISYCDVDGAFMGLPGQKFTVLGIPWLNNDETISVVHILINKTAINTYLRAMNTYKGTAITLVQFIPEDWKKQYGNMQGEQLYSHLYEVEGPDLIFKLVGEVGDTGNIPKELQNELILALHK